MIRFFACAFLVVGCGAPSGGPLFADVPADPIATAPAPAAPPTTVVVVTVTSPPGAGGTPAVAVAAEPDDAGAGGSRDALPGEDAGIPPPPPPPAAGGSPGTGGTTSVVVASGGTPGTGGATSAGTGGAHAVPSVCGAAFTPPPACAGYAPSDPCLCACAAQTWCDAAGFHGRAVSTGCASVPGWGALYCL